MARITNFLMVGGSFAIALGAGMLMQRHEANASQHVAVAPAGLSLLIKTPRQPDRTDPPLLRQISFNPEISSELPVLTVPDLPGALPGTETGAHCDPILNASALPGATAALSFDAPCHPNARVVLHHKGMMFSVVTDATGAARIDVPALSTRALFMAELKDSTSAVATLTIPDMDKFNRVVVQWQGSEGFELHGRQGGASYGGAGDIWRENPMDAANESHLTVLGGTGDNPFSAEIYSFPAHTNPVVTVEMEITPQNCGQMIAAQSLVKSGTDRLRNVDMTVTIPGCDTVGDYIILPNLLSEPKITAS